MHIISNAHGTFSKIDHMVENRTSLNKFKKIEIISSIFSDYEGLKLETNIREKTQKHSNSWKLNSMETNENELTTTQNLWDTAKAVLRGKFIAIQAYLKKRNISNKKT